MLHIPPPVLYLLSPSANRSKAWGIYLTIAISPILTSITSMPRRSGIKLRRSAVRQRQPSGATAKARHRARDLAWGLAAIRKVKLGLMDVLRFSVACWRKADGKRYRRCNVWKSHRRIMKTLIWISKGLWDSVNIRRISETLTDSKEKWKLVMVSKNQAEGKVDLS